MSPTTAPRVGLLPPSVMEDITNAPAEEEPFWGTGTAQRGTAHHRLVCAPAVTDARIFRVTVRVLNRTATDELRSRSGPEYRDFSRQLLSEVKPERRRGAPWGRPSETPARSSSGAPSRCLRRRSPDPALIPGALPATGTGSGFGAAAVGAMLWFTWALAGVCLPSGGPGCRSVSRGWRHSPGTAASVPPCASPGTAARRPGAPGQWPMPSTLG